MATKKQKREAALAKRAAFMEREKARGLQAQQQAQEERKQELKNAIEKNRRGSLLDEEPLSGVSREALLRFIMDL